MPAIVAVEPTTAFGRVKAGVWLQEQLLQRVLSLTAASQLSKCLLSNLLGSTLAQLSMVDSRVGYRF